ncbi:Protein bric-a-brac 2-like protein [Dinothrombium tinctorium]|uniref:Sex-determining region Y protein n=1 Tax=Dinothrombium tinctorium TaxID=1965070 RepID=A0A3S4R9R0_9ACAR|nr:Protein bric-a-brac 2-like protein [Dinothrombium tinctorium]
MSGDSCLKENYSLQIEIPADKAVEDKRIPRPPNAFMIFGQQHRRILAQKYPEYNNKQISKILGSEWRNMTVEKKSYFHKLAEEAYENHMKKYPGLCDSISIVRLLVHFSHLGICQGKIYFDYSLIFKLYSSDMEQLIDDSSGVRMHNQILPQNAQQMIEKGQLIPVYCHHTLYPLQQQEQATQTMVAYSIASIQPFVRSKPLFTMANKNEETALRHCYGDIGFEETPAAPSIYHVSHKDPSLGMKDDSEQFNALKMINNELKQRSNQDFSDLMSNYLPPMDNPAICITPVSSNKEFLTPKADSTDDANGSNESPKNRLLSNKNPKVIVKREPLEDDSNSFILSTVIDVLSAD